MLNSLKPTPSTLPFPPPSTPPYPLPAAAAANGR
ncbi:uncharacterized protein DNG_05487 [Cephalotrichum gorgonifer]|uniref:Uncharacterized protein n=1 Tax=Cephalotrichum gorgonifer TaxID=2041049 RepID=A0AAE8MYF5_9PEZI|nr:uncharacterized protein DNG_05487 [Cephalotrichum gorgonifer]